MGKYLLWAIIILGALFAARIIAHRSAAKSAAKDKPAGAPSPSAVSEHMVRCAHCGIHLPQSDAMLIEGNTWCTQEHARLGVREHV